MQQALRHWKTLQLRYLLRKVRYANSIYISYIHNTIHTYIDGVDTRAKRVVYYKATRPEVPIGAVSNIDHICNTYSARRKYRYPIIVDSNSPSA